MMNPLASLNNKYDIILGSASPRRHQLLHDLGVKFTVIVKPTDESYVESMDKNLVPEFIAKNKAAAFDEELQNKNNLVITADTIVCLKDTIIGKPATIDHAKIILNQLSSNIHTVYTGVCIRSATRQHSFTVMSKVYFKPLTAKEIDYYVDTFVPLDKAGAYGIQEWIGLAGIEKIEGSFHNIMGLPVKELYEALTTF